MKKSTRTNLLCATAGILIWDMPVMAQVVGTPTATPSSPAAVAEESAEGDIIVTARLRNETSISAPVTISALGGEEIARRGITNFDAMARAVPSLLVGEGGGTVQGGIIAIRGLAGADTNPLGDQAVSFSIDGVQVARASIRRLSEMDIAQVEVLKGPQALFFGKNSPAGIISVRTGDPTAQLEAKLSSGYEINAHEWRTEGFVSTPLTETLGLRVAGFYDTMKGWAKNTAPQTGPGIFGHNKRSPDQREYAARGTLKWEPSDAFDARLKYTYADVRSNGSTANVQVVNCPNGVSQGNGPLEDCTADDRVQTGDVGPNFAAADPRFGDGQTRLHQTQQLGGLELNYKISDAFKLTSITGLYKLRLRNLGNFTSNYVETGTLPRQMLPAYNFLDLREITEELRLSTSFDGPVNFLLGGLYQDTHGENGSVTYRNAFTPTFVNNYRLVQNGTAMSVYAQAQVLLLPTLELSGGGRYSYERKKLPVFATATALDPRTLRQIDGTDRDISFNNLSPEFTISYRPTSRFTLYGSYKEGFLSGGYNSVAPILVSSTPGANGRYTTLQRASYDQQLIRGFEVGLKTALFDNSLRINLAAYNYKTSGLQVSVTVQGVQQELRNAGSVRTRGIEADFNYRTPVDGLTITGAVNYNDGKYTDYQASCYRGQSSATCFNQLNRVTGQVALLQDLSGTELVRAPKWTGNLGFNFETPLSSTLKLGLSGNASHSDGYFGDSISSPGARQKGYNLIDGTVRVSTSDDRFELALIGRNLTDKYYFVRATDLPFTGSAPGAAPTGVLGDTGAHVSRGREIMLRATVAFGQ